MPALVTNSKIWGEMFGTKEMRFLFSDESTIQLYLDVEAALARSQSKLNIIPKEAGEKTVSYTHLTLPTKNEV